MKYLSYGDYLLIPIMLSLPAIQYYQFINFLPQFNIRLIYYTACIYIVSTLLVRKPTISGGLLALLALNALIIAYQLVWFPTIAGIGMADYFMTAFAFTAVIPFIFLWGTAISNLKFWNENVLSFALLFQFSAVVVGSFLNFRENSLTTIKFMDTIQGKSYNYLALSDTIAITSLMLLPLIERRVKYTVVVIATAAILTASYSRTSLLLYLVAILLLAIFDKTKRAVNYQILLVGSLVLTYLFPKIESSQNLIRASSLFVDTSSDASFSGRIEFQQRQLDSMYNHLIVGEYLSEIQSGSSVGGYIHNILSYVDSYGIVIFLWLVSIIGFSFYYARSSPPRLVLLCYCALALAFSRSYLWPYIWFALAVALYIPNLIKSREERR